MNGDTGLKSVISLMLSLSLLGICTEVSSEAGADSGILDIGAFSSQAPASGPPDSWEPMTFDGIDQHTRYQLEQDGDTTVMSARSEASASGLVRTVEVDLQEYPWIEWRWKISNVLAGGNVHKKSGDDYPARLYVSFAYQPERASWTEKLRFESYHLLYGEYPPVAAINYIWANQAAIGTQVSNAYIDRVKMIVIQSGDAKANRWQSERRNLLADYRAAFNEDPPPVSGIAIMTDSDNTGGKASAWYGDIRLLKPAAENTPPQ